MLNRPCRPSHRTVIRNCITVCCLFLPVWVSQSIAQELPLNCIQLPSRSQVCPNLLYKRAPVDVQQLEVKEGDAMCICLADFPSLRIAATDEQGKIEQLVSASRAASRLNISEVQLLTLLRE